MKVLKIILFSVLSVFLATYLMFLFVLPNAINLDKYAPQLTSEIQKNTGFKSNISGLRLKTAWNLSGGALIDKTDLMYPTGEKFAQINGLEIKLSLLPFLWGQLRLDSVSLDKIILNLKVDKSGKFLIEKYLPKSGAPSSKKYEGPFKLSSYMPNIKASKYKVTFIDIQTAKAYSVKGSDLSITDFVLDKKIKIKTKGQLILDNRKQISYNLSLFSRVFPKQIDEKTKPKVQNINIISLFKELHKYNLNAVVNADLKMTGEPESPEINGIISLNKIFFVLQGKPLPQSSLKLDFNKEKVKIYSDFYTGVNEKAIVNGVFDNGRKKAINLNVVSKKTDIGNTFLIANTLLQLVGNDSLAGITANGNLNANFNLKSDFKTIHSNGFLKVNNANIAHSLHKASLSSINADIDFSQNSVNIKNSSAKLNGEPIIIKGTIDSKANANLSVFAQKLQLKGLLVTLGQRQILNDNDISSGLVNIKAEIKGRLDKAIPTVDLALENVTLRNKPSNAKIKFVKAQINAVSTGKVNERKFTGKIALFGLKILPKSAVSVISVPNASLRFNEKNLDIDKALVYLNNSKIDVFGRVNDYSSSKMNIDATVRGLMVSKDIKSLLPRQYQSGVEAVGKVPLLIRVTGGKKQEIYAQVLANSKNHLALFNVDSLKGKTTLISSQMSLDGESLNIHELGVYDLNSNSGLSSNMRANTSSSEKIAIISGRISELNSTNPVLHNLLVSIPNQIETSIPGYSGSNMKIKADLEVNGSLSKPSVKGYLSVPSILIPTIKTSLMSVVLHFNKKSISLSCPQLQVANSLMGFNSIIDNDFSRGIVVKSVDFYSSYLDLNTLGVALSHLPQSSNGPGADLGVSVLSGKGHINKFKTGGMVATNVISDFVLKDNILKLSNVDAEAYFGKVKGEVSYNLIYGNIALNLQGRGLSAGPAIKGLTSFSDKITGQLDFDSKVSMVGYTQEQLLGSLKGNTEFVISNGKMGTLGKLEHLLYAQNIIANNFFKTTLNVIAKALTVKDTGVFKYLKGKMTFSGGWANLSYIKTSGPSMSMYITGSYNLLNNSANLIILGRLSDDVVRMLGPIGDFSMDKVLSYIPKLGAITSYLINQITTDPEYENTSSIPYLTPKTDIPTKEFKVLLNGGIESQSSVKSFKWLSKPVVPEAATRQGSQSSQPTVNEVARQVVQQVVTKYTPSAATTGERVQYVPQKKIIAPVADFINALPDLK